MEKSDYAALLEQAQQEEAAAQAEVEKVDYGWRRAQKRWAEKRSAARDALEAAERQVQQAKRQPYLDALNAAREEAFPLVEQLESVGLSALGVVRQIDAIWQAAQDDAIALAKATHPNAGASGNHPFVASWRVESRMQLPRSQRPRSYGRAFGLLDEHGERVFIS